MSVTFDLYSYYVVSCVDQEEAKTILTQKAQNTAPTQKGFAMPFKNKEIAQNLNWFSRKTIYSFNQD